MFSFLWTRVLWSYHAVRYAVMDYYLVSIISDLLPCALSNAFCAGTQSKCFTWVNSTYTRISFDLYAYWWHKVTHVNYWNELIGRVKETTISPGVREILNKQNKWVNKTKFPKFKSLLSLTFLLLHQYPNLQKRTSQLKNPKTKMLSPRPFPLPPSPWAVLHFICCNRTWSLSCKLMAQEWNSSVLYLWILSEWHTKNIKQEKL